MNKEEQERTRNKCPNEPQGVDLRIRPSAALGSRIPAAKSGGGRKRKKKYSNEPQGDDLRLRPGAALGLNQQQKLPYQAMKQAKRLGGGGGRGGGRGGRGPPAVSPQREINIEDGVESLSIA